MITMASIVVRQLEDTVKEALALRAKENGNSMEAEARSILTDAVRPKNIGVALYEASREAAAEIPIPPRDDEARAVSF